MEFNFTSRPTSKAVYLLVNGSPLTDPKDGKPIRFAFRAGSSRHANRRLHVLDANQYFRAIAACELQADGISWGDLSPDEQSACVEMMREAWVANGLTGNNSTRSTCPVLPDGSLDWSNMTLIVAADAIRPAPDLTVVGGKTTSRSSQATVTGSGLLTGLAAAIAARRKPAADPAE